MPFFTFLILFLSVCVQASNASDANKTLKQLTEKYGFGYEEHSVVTEDGYVLGLYRIPGVKDEKSSKKRPPVLLMHGIWADMMCWVYNDENLAPAYNLVRAGYDVWLGNVRGTRWSEKHLALDSRYKAFWNFSWEEYGTYDVPAFIQKIQKQTGYKKVAYIGVS